MDGELLQRVRVEGVEPPWVLDSYDGDGYSTTLVSGMDEHPVSHLAFALSTHALRSYATALASAHNQDSLETRHMDRRTLIAAIAWLRELIRAQRQRIGRRKGKDATPVLRGARVAFADGWSEASTERLLSIAEAPANSSRDELLAIVQRMSATSPRTIANASDAVVSVVGSNELALAKEQALREIVEQMKPL